MPGLRLRNPMSGPRAGFGKTLNKTRTVGKVKTGVKGLGKLGGFKRGRAGGLGPGVSTGGNSFSG